MTSSPQLRGALDERRETILTPDALAFLTELHRRFEPARRELTAARARRQAAFDDGERPAFRADGADVRAGDWRVAPAPPALANRRVEITGPTERKMVINALNSGANVLHGGLRGRERPTWENMIDGQANLREAIGGTISSTRPRTGTYRLNERTATLLPRPRGLHLLERHVLVDGDPIAGPLFDFGLYFFHNATALLAKGAGPYFYVPKLQAREEARWWNDVFVFAQDALGVDQGTIKATVLVETLPAAFEMDEMLYELREHSAGLNAGRWDYIFSAIKTLREDPDALLPDRAAVTMTVPFMRAYTELLVATCHRRGAHAIGGMAAFVPNRRDQEATERALAQVRADKEREAGDGFDGTWVAHPDLVATAIDVFQRQLGERPNQLERTRDDVRVEASQLLDVTVPDAEVTESRRARQRERRDPLPRGLARRQRRSRAQPPDGGRRDRRDRARADLAVGPSWRGRRRRPARRRAGARARRRGAGGDPRRGRRRGVRRRALRARARAVRADRARRAARRLPHGAGVSAARRSVTRVAQPAAASARTTAARSPAGSAISVVTPASR